MPPKNIGELFQFYNEYVKLLYSSIEAQNKLPFEVLFEINSAFDHLSRHWTYNEAEKVSIDKAFAHLKRCCLDIFKLRAKKANEQYEELKKLDLSFIDNGDYEKALIKLYHEIEVGTRKARQSEGDSRYDDEHVVKAFDLWQPVFRKAVQLERDFYLHPKLEWAKRKNSVNKFIFNWKTFLASIIASYVAGIISNEWILQLIKKHHVDWRFYFFIFLSFIGILVWSYIIKNFFKSSLFNKLQLRLSRK